MYDEIRDEIRLVGGLRAFQAAVHWLTDDAGAPIALCLMPASAASNRASKDLSDSPSESAENSGDFTQVGDVDTAILEQVF